jgi:sugar transferase (PEP-CTERM system associated)
MNFFKNPIISKNMILVFGDIVIGFLSFYAGFFIRFYFGDVFSLSQYSPLFPKAIVFSIFIISISFLMDLYGIEKGEGRKKILLKILFAGVFVFVALAAIYYFVPFAQVGRGILFIAICVSIMMQSIWHVIFYFGLKRIPGVARNVLILGTGPVARTLGRLFDTTKNNLALAGYINCVNEPVLVPHEYVVGNGESLLDIALREKAHKIIVSLTERRGTFPVREVLNCKLKGIEIIDGPSFYEQMLGKLLIENVNPSWFIFSEGFNVTIFRRYFKRIFDVSLAIAGFIIFLPFLFIIPILIKLDSKGPVILKQERIGESEKIFTLYKFRTMVEGAERDTGPVWSQENDRRITRLGRFLRKSRLDEIPQLYNVLRGDMSFIGPRPERPFFVESLKKQIPYYSERYCVKPGITGWAQVRYEYGDSVEDAIEKLKYDLYYIKHLSFSLDLLIMLDTTKVILFGRGGR